MVSIQYSAIERLSEVPSANSSCLTTTRLAKCNSSVATVGQGHHCVANFGLTLQTVAGLWTDIEITLGHIIISDVATSICASAIVGIELGRRGVAVE